MKKGERLPDYDRDLLQQRRINLFSNISIPILSTIIILFFVYLGTQEVDKIEDINVKIEKATLRLPVTVKENTPHGKIEETARFLDSVVESYNTLGIQGASIEEKQNKVFQQLNTLKNTLSIQDINEPIDKILSSAIRSDNTIESTVIHYQEEIAHQKKINTKLASEILELKKLIEMNKGDYSKSQDRLSVITIYFTFDSYDITANDKEKLSKLAQSAEEINALRIEVKGYADTWGDPEYNQMLSENRARTIEVYLSNILKDRIETNSLGYGESELEIETKDMVMNDYNRRAVVEIIKNH